MISGAAATTLGSPAVGATATSTPAMSLAVTPDSRAMDTCHANDAEAAIFLFSAITGAVFFLWTPYIRLGRRVAWRRLLPTGMLTGAGLLALGIGSAIVMPDLVSNNTVRYGLIGFTFSVVSWLFCVALLVVSTAILGAVLDGERELPARFWEI